MEFLDTLIAHAPQLGAILLAAFCAGLIAGLFGVGGGTVVVPALFFALPLFGATAATAMHVAVATSLANIIPTGFTSARAHWRRGAVDIALIRRWAPAIVIGVLIGTALAAWAEGRWLTLLFGVVVLLVAANLMLRKDGVQLSPTLPRAPWLDGIGGLIGALSAMVGIGGGSLVVPTLTFCGVDIRRAVGTAAAIGLVIAIPGVIGFVIGGWGVEGRPPLSIGYVNPVALAIVAPVSALVAPLGARLAHRLPPSFLRAAFGVFLLFIGARMIFDGVTG